MNLKKWRTMLTLLAMALIGTGLSLPTGDAITGSSAPPLKTVQIRLPGLISTVAATNEPAEAALSWREFRVSKGDTMARIFRRAGEQPATLHGILSSGKIAERLKHLQIGQTIEFGYGQGNRLQQLRCYSPNKVKQLTVSRENEQWRPELISEKVEIRIAHATTVISDSLFMSGSRANLSDGIIMQMAGIFGWDIDFALDVRKGDKFSIIYETRYLDGEKIGDGDIIAAEFINRNKSHQAIRYTTAGNHTEYFSANGHSMRKAFLRTPVKFSRISSRFANKRWHPVLKRWRAHRGVDYAAPRGTPIKATSAGKITFKGTKGGYGKSIFIQHGKTYTTVYGHLSRYAKKLRSGTRVKQGQIIGYVGSTGLATGPHLHYELRIGGVHQNPLTANLPKARPIAKKYLQDFKHKAQPLLSRLALISAARFANIPRSEQQSLPN